MRIAFLISTPYGFGGAQRILAIVASRLTQKHKVILVHTRINPEYGDVLAYEYSPDVEFIYESGLDVLSGSSITRKIVRRLNSRGLAPLSGSALGCLYYPERIRNRLEKFVVERQLDCVVGVTGSETTLLALAAPRLPCKCVGWMHNSFAAYFRTQNKYLWKQESIARTCLKNLDVLIVLTRGDQKAFGEAFGCTVRSIYNPITIQCDRSADPLSHTLIFCGRMVKEQKGLDYLAGILVGALGRRTDWNAVIVGDGPDKAWFEQEIARSGLYGKVVFAGKQKDVTAHYQKASILISTSRWEGFGLVVTEAFACGLPVVSFRTEGPSEIIRDGIDGFLIDNYDVRAFEAQLLRLMDNEGLRVAMSKAALERAKDFSLDAIMRQWNQIFCQPNAEFRTL